MSLATRITFLLSILASAALGAPAQPAAKAPGNDDCQTCHADKDAKRADGRPIFVKAEAFAASVHGQAGVACVDCHADLAKTTDFPHADKLAGAKCSACHDAVVTEYGKGVHAQARQNGHNAFAASCADCHGTHDILPAKDPASRTNALNLPGTCAHCHGIDRHHRKGKIAAGNVAALYMDSIHGKAVSEERTGHGAQLQDVPRHARHPPRQGSGVEGLPAQGARDLRVLPPGHREAVRGRHPRHAFPQWRRPRSRLHRLPHGP